MSYKPMNPSTNGATVRDQCFADDTTLYLWDTPKNLQRSFEVLELICSTSGFLLTMTAPHEDVLLDALREAQVIPKCPLRVQPNGGLAAP